MSNRFEDKKENGKPVYEKLPLFSDFQKRVLRSVMEAINQDADNNLIDIRFTYERVDLNGRQTNPDKLRFKVEPSELGKSIRNDKMQAREVIEMERRLKTEFGQTDKQVRSIMKRLPLDKRDYFARKLNELSARMKNGKISIGSDANGYWNKTFCNFLDKLQAEDSEPIKQETATEAQEAKEEVRSCHAWEAFLISAKERVGEENFSKWISQLTLENTEEPLTIGVPSRTFFELFSQNFPDVIRELCSDFRWIIRVD